MAKPIRAISGVDPRDPLPWLPWAFVIATVGVIWWGTLQPKARRLL